MTGKVSATLCFIVGACLLVCAHAQSPSSHSVARRHKRNIVLSFVAVGSNETFVTTPDFPKFGSSIIFNNPVFDAEQVEEIGEEGGRCDAMRTFGKIYCNLAFNFKGRGEIQVAGMGSFVGEEVLAVVGGTGEFVRVTGSVHGIPVPSAGLSFQYTAYLRL